MRGVANGTGDLAESDLAGSLAKAVDVALIFGEPVGELQAEGDGLGVNAVGAANLRGVLKFVGAEIEDFAEEDKVAFDDAGSVAEEEGLRGVDHIVGGHAVVEPAGGGGVAHGFADSHGESNDVVFNARFNFVDTVDVDFGARAQERDGFGGNLAGGGERFGGGEFDIEPLLEAIGVAPDMSHFLAGVAWNQVKLLSSAGDIMPRYGRVAWRQGTAKAAKRLGSGKLAARGRT